LIQTDVCIIGGGPAGAATALTLGRYTKHRCLVIESSNYDSPRVGETVSSGLMPLLSYLGAESILTDRLTAKAYGSAGAWGSDSVTERDSIYSRGGQGLHLDRLGFDRALAAATNSLGDILRTGTRFRDVARQHDGWVVDIEGPRGHEQVLAKYIVDATGRQARVARRMGAQRLVSDRLVGLVCHFALPEGPAVQTTFVETIADGWWYTAPLPNRQAVVALMTDADLLRALDLRAITGFLAKLATTAHAGTRLLGAHPITEPRVFPSESHVLQPAVGAGWVAAGDAACAFDPLASLGVGYAITSGIQAARIVDEWLRGENGLAEAYPGDIAGHAATYSAQRQELYSAERRWPNSPFWKRRLAPR